MTIDRRLASARPTMLIMVAWVVTLALCGGASRADDWHQLAVRLGALAVILFAFWPRRGEEVVGSSAPLLFVACCAAVPLIQLIPLPTAFWMVLPGHAFYGSLLQDVGIPDRWRPISLSPDLTINALLACLPAFATLALMRCFDRRQQRQLLWLLLACATVNIVLGVFQMALGPNTALRFYTITNRDSPVGLFANRNHSAIFLACTIPLMAVAVRTGRAAAWNGNARLLAPVAGTLAVMLVILATGSRGGLIAAAVAIAATAVFAFCAAPVAAQRGIGRRERERIWRGLLPWASGLVIAAIALIGYAAVQNRLPALYRLLDTHQGSELRMAWWPALFETMRTFFPVGSGMGSFDVVYRRFEPFDQLTFTYANEAHNDLLQLAIEAGLPGLVLLGAGLWWYLRSCFRLWTTPSSAPEKLDLPRAATIVIAIILLTSLGDYPVRTPLLSSLMAIAASWLAVGLHSQRPPAPAQD